MLAVKLTPLAAVPWTKLPVDRVTLPDSVGAALSTTLPVPVLVVAPVPPLRTGKAVPDKVIAKVPLVVMGEPATDKKAGTDAATEVTLPLPLLLNVLQSVELNAPRLDADAVGTFSVITGVVVPFATVLVRSVPVVPRVSAATLVTVPCGFAAVVIVVTRP